MSDATFAAFGIDAVYTPARGEPVSVRVIARRLDTIVGFGETRVYAETATFEVAREPKLLARARAISSAVGGETFVIQGGAGAARSGPARLDAGFKADVSGGRTSDPALFLEAGWLPECPGDGRNAKETNPASPRRCRFQIFPQGLA